ncbi:uncharacterized protein N7479_000526 [Penicillium vulpinum]|uniref:Uncharacterized protein n=1 Tax=Penicillium vulpinum TaxID=29845 RepID=A0A1V6S6K1_9EURO|nr:uncharacterized protein N7479_000526 [Penicillium vulpinum]KAJ5970608.1 hypothetical protein N7479_000526 [Penicillium vulpinum]OQE09253.1 hypothetical protein PENVUL_c007G01901 [Penicillium vulpinum]
MGNPNFASGKSAEAVSNPPPYSSITEPIDEPPTYQQPNVSHSISRDGVSTSEETVGINECITHLKFLAATAKLRNFIRGTDKLFGVCDSEIRNFPDPRKQSQAAVRIQEKRWAVYVARAVERFTVWWQTCLPSLNSSRISMLDSSSEAKIAWSTDMMPPLDVLMVWHAYMLNPHAFLEDCLRQSKMSLWATGLPWDVVNASIDDETLVFYPGSKARINFETRTGQSWENIDDTPTKALFCLGCKQEIIAPWTEGSIGCDPDVAFAHCIGYADKSLRASCPACKFSITHDSLRVQKFRNDVQKLLKDDLPMPGTLLSQNGTPADDENDDNASFPNQLIKEGMRSELLQLTDLTENGSATIETIRDHLEGFLKSRSLMRRVNKTILAAGNSSMPERISLRNMLSRYWDNSSPFAIDLVGAVIRQGTFVDKMDKIGWIRSPNLRSTMGHFVSKYDMFFQIMAKNKGHAVVPTLDIDLIWHTHQLSPARYYTFSTAQTEGIFINHDDKIDEIKLNDAFAWTSKQYQKLTGGKIYSECICWYCEALRESSNQGLSRLISPSTLHAKTNAARLHDSADTTTDGRSQGPHISSHNAVRILAQSDPRAIQTKTAQLESCWEKAQRRSHNRSGSRGGGSAYEDPLRKNSHGPYERDPEILREIYPCNPACVNITAGVVGNCISGTHGVGLAQGACVSGTMSAQTRSKGKSFCAGMAGCGVSL